MTGHSSRILARTAQTKISKASPFKLRVRKSGIHRLGVFAAQNIPPKRKVVEYAGERISRRETRRRFLEGSPGRSRRLNYLARLDSYWSIDGAAGGNGAELINHSCEPNLALSRSRKRLWLVSLRRVRAGEELRYDYHFAKNGERVRCHCGSPKCRGKSTSAELALEWRHVLIFSTGRGEIQHGEPVSSVPRGITGAKCFRLSVLRFRSLVRVWRGDCTMSVQSRTGYFK